jgi:Ca2+-binding RTX toxin-like protein
MGAAALVVVLSTLVATAVPAVKPASSSLSSSSDAVARAPHGAPLCQDRAATIVGPNTRHGTIRGTAGPDVVVAGRATRISTGGGRDLVCLTGPRRAYTVWTGPGADRVVRTGALGGRGGRDVVRTGGGDDRVDLDDGTAGDGSVVGGPGSDYLVVHDTGEPLAVDLAVDTRDGTGTRGGRPWLRFGAFEDFYLPSPAGYRLDFTGSAAAESLTLSAADISDQPSYAGTVDMRGGDDRVALPLTWREVEARDRTVRGGPGDDTFRVSSEEPTLDLTVDAAEGTVTGSGFGTTEVDGFETYAPLSRGPLTVLGSDAGEEVLVSSCGATVDTAGGADRVVAVPIPVYDDYADPGCPVATASRQHGHPRRAPTPAYYIDGPLDVDAGAGDDVVVGSRSDDRIDGGDGIDTVDGAGGTDTCAAETVLRCEAGPAEARGAR